MDLADLELVVTTAEAGTLTLAAERLHVAQPALTRRLARLERELGGSLFDRGRHGAHPTPAGETLADGAAEVLQTMRVLERRTRDAIAGRVGHLRIGTAPTLGADILPPVLAAHRRAHPDVDLDVTSNGDSNWLLHEVSSRRLDVALTVVPAQLDRDLVLAVSRRQTFVLVVPSGHPLAEVDVVSRSRLVGERLVAIRAGEGLRQLLDRVFRELDVDPDVSIETTDREMLLPLVAAGMGVTLVPDHFARRRLVEGVEARPLRPAVHRRVGAILARGEASRQARDLVARLADEWPRD
jgi:DNA-binding transcriptional LysR family regulator